MISIWLGSPLKDRDQLGSAIVDGMSSRARDWFRQADASDEGSRKQAHIDPAQSP